MRLRNYHLADYRLAAYVVVAAVIAGGVAFGLDRAFAPTAKVEANGAPPAASASGGAVRQIPIARSGAADLGDPDGKLTPVYPTSPGKDLPIKDTPVIAAVKPAGAPAVAATTGNASAPAAVAALAPVAPAPVAAAPVANAAPVATAAAPAANACNVAVCAAAYRSFRESDCSYQPLVGGRRVCEGAPGLSGPSSTGQVASQPPPPVQSQSQQTYQPPAQQQMRPPVQQQARTQFDLRRLPPPPGRFDEDDDDRGPVVMEAPERRYDLRRNWVSEPQE